MSNRARFEENKRKRENRVRKRKIVVFSIFVCIAIIVAAFCFMFMAPAFNISNIICEGNVRIGSDEIVSASGIENGVNILSTNFGEARKAVKNLKYVEDCTIKRELPSTVKIHIVETRPYAYFSVGSILAIADTGGTVIDLVSSADTAMEIETTKITLKEPEPSSSPEASPKEEQSNIWGYDQDGDPIYKVNGGHYEFDDDGKRFFVDDSVSTAEPEEAQPQSTYTWSGNRKFEDLPKTADGTVIFDAPIVYGIEITNNVIGEKLKSSDQNKLDLVLRILKALDHEGILERATQIDIENINDVRVFVEDRLEILFGSFEDVEYKTKFVSAVINENLSKYEHAILDYRDSKLYVRSSDTSSPQMVEKTPGPGSKAKSSASPSSKDDSEDDGDNDEGSETTESTSSPSSTTSPKPTSSPKTSTPKPTSD